MCTFFFIFFLLASAPRLLNSASFVSLSRRILHQPLVPLDTIPPAHPPNPPPPSPPVPAPPNPKYPFSTATPNSPFFPTYPSPPPPPSPASFASFPANISSLILPQAPKSKSSSGKLLGVAIAAVLAAVVVVGISAFFYCRRRRKRYSADEKNLRSDSSLRLFPANAETNNGSRKVRHTSSTSSEFLYLGTIVNSRGIDDRPDSRNNDGGGGGLDPRKMDSPELQPLPPLARQASRQHGAHNDGSSTVDEEDEEFYSPRGSSGGRESSSGTGSGSRRVFAAIADENFGRRSSNSSSSSYSSSTSGSPDRSHSISLSPPVSLSPRRSEPKSPEATVVQNLPASPPPLSQLPPQLQNGTELIDETRSQSSSSLSSPDRNRALSPALSPVYNQYMQSSSLSSSSSTPKRAFCLNSQSPLLSPLSLSPNRPLQKNPDAEVRASSASPSPASSSPGRNVEKISHVSPRLSSASEISLPQRNLEKISYDSPKLSNASDRSLPGKNVEKISYGSPRLSNASNHSSPDRNVQKISNESPRLSNASYRSGKSESSSSSAFSLPSSPEKVFEQSLVDHSPRLSNVSDRYRQSPLPSRPLSPTLLSSPEIELNFTSNQPAILENVLDPSRESPAPAPPPPPPSQRKHWEIPVLAKPIVQPLRVSPPPPPPPPPPSASRQRKHWEIPAPSTPTTSVTPATPVGQPISRPPELIPPSRPFVLQTPTTKVSPVELPPNSQNVGVTEETPKPKLKPLHWDKVRASSDREMVWDHLRSSSFKLNEEMIETLFVVNAPNTKPKDTTPCSVLPPPHADDRVLDPKKSQNIAILLRALNVTMEEVCEALLEGSADTLGTELLESLLKMAPSKEEERKLKEHKDDSPTKLGTAEKFLKAVLDVPFAFKRVEAMLYIANFESEMEYLRKSFETLEAACEELRNSRMFLKLLEAVLKTGNRMNVGTNRGDAHAFKLDTLLKLVDVKGADGKTTLLHFVVQEIIRTEGARLSSSNQTPNTALNEDARCRKLGLQVVSSLSSELANVKKAAAMDSEMLSNDVSKLSKGIANITEVVQLNETTKSDESSEKFSESMNKFMRMAEEEILKIQAQESVALSLVKEITEYFHGNLSKEEAHPFRIFMVVRDFLTILDRVCKEVGMINERTIVSSAHKFPVPVNPMLPQPLPGLAGRRQQYSSSDDDSPSP
ncbi:hypothetical protein L6164_002976 [Bauhinia variegata]|uniref:Uncharacterized protein n=1 Tax=Bauhinia variegata TaxID=167791 RepID=A0ACB9Q2L2_BAUVA|nr:hypothetical protein L6164_002976 [Bauhinia variegata]